jgi:Uri superfamily endonuclease
MSDEPTDGPRAEPGTYALLLRADAEQTIAVGALGELTVRPGGYVYVGSAFGPGGVRARVRRHARADGARHWHVDYLRSGTTLEAVWYTHDPTRRECAWAAALRSRADVDVPLGGFGASDCDCSSHLVAVPSAPSFAAFRDRMQDEWPDHAPLRRVDGAALPGD